MSHDEQRRPIDVTQAFRLAAQAMTKGDWEGSCQMFRQCVNLAPENLLFRQSLRGVTELKYQNNRNAVTIPDTVQKELQAKIQRAAMLRDWNEVVTRCEEGLALDPWNAWLNAHLGDALAELGIIDGAVFLYECAYKQARDREDYLFRLSELYEWRGNYERAIECLKKLGRLDDSTLRRLDELIEKAKSCLPADHEPFVRSLPSRGRSEEELRRAIDRYPLEIENYLTLAYRLRDVGNIEEAVALLERAYERSRRQEWVREIWEDLEMELLRKALTLAKIQLQKDPGDEIAQRNYRLQNDRFHRRDQEFVARRSSRHASQPSEAFQKYELAIRHMSEKRHSEAIPLLFSARAHPPLRLKSLLALGKCFVVTRQVDLAQRQFELALAETGQDRDVDLLQEIRCLLDRLRRDPPDFDPGCPVPRP